MSATRRFPAVGFCCRHPSPRDPGGTTPGSRRHARNPSDEPPRRPSEAINHSRPRLGLPNRPPADRTDAMTLLLAFLLVPLAAAIVLARGEPIRTISCLGAMGVGCVIACWSVMSLLRQRA
jgi:hypothetical protein